MSEDTDFNEGRERGQERVARLLQLDVHERILVARMLQREIQQ